MRSQTQRLRRGERGQALAEFALTLPFLLFLLAGIIEFGRAYHIQQIVTDASREGARLTVVDDVGVPSIQYVHDRVKLRLVPAAVDTARATVTIEPAASWRLRGEAMTVTVTVPYRMGFVGALMDWVGGSGEITLSATTVMRNE